MKAILGPLALLVLLAPLAAATRVDEVLALQPRCTAAPATLAASAEGTTTVGAGGTSATTTYASHPQTRAVLLVNGGSGTWNVTLRHVASSFQGNDALTVALGSGATSSTQVQIALGAAATTTGAPLALAAGGALEVRVTGNLAGNSARTLDLRIMMQDADAGGPVVEYTYHLDLT